jgi:hypothetical protein
MPTVTERSRTRARTRGKRREKFFISCTSELCLVILLDDDRDLARVKLAESINNIRDDSSVLP